MSRRTRALTAAAVLTGAGAAGGVVLADGAEQPTAAARQRPPTTARVQLGALRAMVSLDGTLTYRARSDGLPYAVINRAGGTYTELPEAGDEADCGDVLYRVDDDPVLLLCGAVPAYRDLARGDEGRDVRQLNRNLHELGYDADPDGHRFTRRTARALEGLQDDKGLGASGALDLGEAVVLPRPGRISKVTGEPGGPARPGAAIAQATSDTLWVQAELAASQQGAVKRGDRARITLPGNRSVTGRVDRLGRVARVPAGRDGGVGAATIPAFIRLDDPQQARGLDRAPVRVDVTTKGVARALSVPVTALVGRSGGGFAVEVVRDGGRRELVAVAPGLFDTDAGRVAVDGNVHAGDRVVVPSP